tara:strand:- start:7932 stop:10172 length:2241 start_codon:yes stop_codon:yes gene_type:complete
MKYTPKYKIKSVKFTHKGKQYDVESSNVLTGIYEYEKGGKLKDYTYISKNDVKEFVTEGKIIKTHSNGIWVLSKVLKETPKKAIKKSTPKKEIKKTTTNKKSVSKAKIGTLLTPSEKFKGKKNMPVEAFEIAENIVEMRKAKAKKSETMKLQDSLSEILRSEKNFKDWHEPLAYTVLWLNFNMPMTYGFAILTEQSTYGLGLIEAYKKEFKNFPDVSKKVVKIKTGNFTSNIIEQKLSKDFAGNDDLRPNMKYTYIDDGYALSTDAHKLLGIYDKSLLGKEEFFGDKDELWRLGKMAKYPNWRQVVPTPNQFKTKKINAQLLYNFLLKLIKYKATSGYSYGMVIKIDNETTLGFNTRFLIESLATSMKFGDDVYIHYSEGLKGKPVLFTNIKDWDLGKPNSTFVLTMPIMVDDRSNLAYLIYDLNTESYEKGGEVKQTIDALKKGDEITIKFGSSVSKDNSVNLKVRSRNKVRKGTIDKITFENTKNPKGVKFYAYERGGGRWFFAMGDMAISNIEIVSNVSMAKGGIITGTGKSGLDKIKKTSKDNPSQMYKVTDDNYSNIGNFYLKNGKFAKKTVSNADYDFAKNKVSLRPKSDVIYKATEIEGKGGYFEKGGEIKENEIRLLKANIKQLGGKDDGIILKEVKPILAKYKGRKKTNNYSELEKEDLEKLLKTNIRLLGGKDSKEILRDSFYMVEQLSKKSYAKGGKTKTKKPNSFFAVVKREQKEGESWKDAIQRVKKEKSEKK